MNTLKNILTLAGKELRSLLGDPILIILTLYMYTGVVIAMSQSNTDITKIGRASCRERV